MRQLIGTRCRPVMKKMMMTLLYSRMPVLDADVLALTAKTIQWLDEHHDEAKHLQGNYKHRVDIHSLNQTTGLSHFLLVQQQIKAVLQAVWP